MDWDEPKRLPWWRLPESRNKGLGSMWLREKQPAEQCEVWRSSKTRVETGCSGSFRRRKGNVAEELVEVGVRGSSLREFPPPRPVKCGTKPKHKERNQTHTRKVPSSPLNVRKADAAWNKVCVAFNKGPGFLWQEYWGVLPFPPPAHSEGQGSLACCSPWSHKESDTT